MNTEAMTLLSDMLQPFGQLTPQAAKEVANLAVPDSVQSRVSVLAEKNNAGTITEEERDEYETLVKYGNVLSVIKAKARKVASDSA